MLLSGGGVEILYVFSPLFFEVSCLGCACNLPWCPLPSHPWNVGRCLDLFICFNVSSAVFWFFCASEASCTFLARIFSKGTKHVLLSGSLEVLLLQSRGLVSLQCELRLRASDPFTNDTSGSRRLEGWRLHQRLIKTKCVHKRTFFQSDRSKFQYTFIVFFQKGSGWVVLWALPCRGTVFTSTLFLSQRSHKILCEKICILRLAFKGLISDEMPTLEPWICTLLNLFSRKDSHPATNRIWQVKVPHAQTT